MEACTLLRDAAAPRDTCRGTPLRGGTREAKDFAKARRAEGLCQGTRLRRGTLAEGLRFAERPYSPFDEPKTPGLKGFFFVFDAKRIDVAEPPRNFLSRLSAGDSHSLESPIRTS